jgi:hypothetical protein
MGYLTTISIRNDALHSFEKDPEKFGKAILDAIDEANCDYKPKTVPFKGYCNYIEVFPSRHADETTIYLNKGNSLTEMSPWSKEFKELLDRRPDLIEGNIETIKFLIKEAKVKLNKKNTEKNE